MGLSVAMNIYFGVHLSFIYCIGLCYVVEGSVRHVYSHILCVASNFFFPQEE